MAIVINNVTDLQNMALDLAGDYELGGNIDASATVGWNGGLGFDPIGSIGSAFTGTLDGKGYSITDLTINRGLERDVGLIGFMQEATIQNVTLVAPTIVGAKYVGALVGTQATLGALNIVSNCHVSGGTVSGLNSTGYHGGLIGAGYETDVDDCTCSATVSGTGNVGGLIGNLSSVAGASTVSNCSAAGNVTGTNALTFAGGLIGQTGGGDVDNCFASGNVQGLLYVGSLVGYIGSAGADDFTDCSASGGATGTDNVGGFVGFFQAGVALRCHASGSADGNNHVGGFAGYSNGGDYTSCSATGSVSSAVDYAGGFAGTLANAVVSQCFSKGSVSSVGAAGGFAGQITGWTVDIDDCYSWSDATSTTVNPAKGAAGFVFYQSAGFINTSYSVGVVSEGGGAGGGFCASYVAGNNADCFWDTETSGQAASAVGAGKTTSEMQQQATFTNFDFVSIWDIPPGFSATATPSSGRAPLVVAFQASGNFGYPFFLWE